MGHPGPSVSPMSNASSHNGQVNGYHHPHSQQHVSPAHSPSPGLQQQQQQQQVQPKKESSPGPQQQQQQQHQVVAAAVAAAAQQQLRNNNLRVVIPGAGGGGGGSGSQGNMVGRAGGSEEVRKNFYKTLKR